MSVTLTKEKYLEPLAAKIATMKGTDEEITAALNAPVATGETKTVSREMTEVEAARAKVVAQADVEKFDAEMTKAFTEEVPIMGPSWGRTIGIGNMHVEFIGQARAWAAEQEAKV